LRKQRTVAVDNVNVDFLVETFTSHDNAVLRSLGSHAKETKWRVSTFGVAETFDVAVTADTSYTGGVGVGVVWGSDAAGKPNQVWPVPGPNAQHSSKLKEDFVHNQKFRGMLSHIGERNHYELHTTLVGNSAPYWYPATVEKQHQDGTFSARVSLPTKNTIGMDTMEEHEVPIVKRQDLREAATKAPAMVAEKALQLHVPVDHPLDATLMVDNEDITHFFGRQTGYGKDKLGKRPVQLNFRVDKERRNVTADVGLAQVQDYLGDEASLISFEPHHLSTSWTVSFGEFAEHVIKLEKRYKSSKIVTLSVDGDVLVEATAEDLHCASGWECTFRLVGKKTVNFEVYETDADGVSLDSKATVSKSTPFVKTLRVRIPDETNFNTAELTVNDATFDCVTERRRYQAERFEMRIETFFMTFKIPVPSKVNDTAKTGAEISWEGFTGWWSSLRAGCMTPRTASLDESAGVVIQPVDKASP
jgi:hypothetical protein